MSTADFWAVWLTIVACCLFIISSVLFVSVKVDRICEVIPECVEPTS